MKLYVLEINVNIWKHTVTDIELYPYLYSEKSKVQNYSGIGQSFL